MSYHNGSVWPHDTAPYAAGLARYGERRGAIRIRGETFEAAVHFGMRLSELYCGFARAPREPPIAYPVACLPQAWSAGAVFMMLQACLVARRGPQRQARELAALKQASMRAQFWLGSAKVNPHCFVRAVKAWRVRKAQ